jgi:hypothetical protein
MGFQFAFWFGDANYKGSGQVFEKKLQGNSGITYDINFIDKKG